MLEDAHTHVVLEVLGVLEARALAREDVAEAPNVCFVPEVGAQLERLLWVRVVSQLPKEQAGAERGGVEFAVLGLKGPGPGCRVPEELRAPLAVLIVSLVGGEDE